MTVDKFGHFAKNRNKCLDFKRNANKIAIFALNSDNNIDIKNHRIQNVLDPMEEGDVVNKSFLQKNINQITQDLLKTVEQKNNKQTLELNKVKKIIEANQTQYLNAEISYKKDLDISLASFKKDVSDRLESLEKVIYENTQSKPKKKYYEYITE